MGRGGAREGSGRPKIKRKKYECKKCKKIFYDYASKKSQFCSHKCFYKHRKWFKGKRSKCWLGENVSYSRIHKWLVAKFGNPKKCEECGSKEKVEWANISGKYKRDKSDYRGLCRKCHAKIDDVVNKSWKVRKKCER